MARMEMRTREAPMEWEREQDRNLPNIFSNPQPPADQTTTPATSNGQLQRPFGFGASVQRGSSFSSNQGSFTSEGRGATTPKPFHQDSQLSAGAATFSRQDSFSFGSGGGSFSRPQSPNNTAPQSLTGAGATTLHRDGSATSEVMDVDEYPSTLNAKTRGSELFDMGSLRNDVVAEQRGLSPRRMPGKTRSSSSSAMVGSRTSSMQYRGSGSAGRGSKFWSDDDDEDNDEDMNEPEDDSEEDNYGRRRSGRQPNRHKTRNMDGRRQGRDLDRSERRRSDHVRSLAPQGRVWSENVDLPYILSGYVQVAMNSAFVGIVIYIIYNFITTIQSDISNRAEEALRQEQQKINNCERDYRANNCNVLPVPPLLILPCQILSDCMNTPPPRIERSTVAAQTFAVIFNSFVHTISYKTMGFLVVIVFGGLYFSNHAISSYRHNHLIHHQDPIAHPGYAPPPPSTSGSITAGATNTNSMIPAGLKRNDSNNLSNNGGSFLGSTLSLNRGGGSHMSSSSSKSLTLQNRGSGHAFPNSDNE